MIGSCSLFSWKKSVTGSGRASKDQVARMAMQLLGLSERPAEDAADALCVAMCHAMRLSMLPFGEDAGTLHNHINIKFAPR